MWFRLLDRDGIIAFPPPALGARAGGEVLASLTRLAPSSSPAHLTVDSERPNRPEPPMRQYLDLMERVLSEGVDKRDRTGVGTRAIFGHQMRFDLQRGFPLVTTKK